MSEANERVLYRVTAAGIELFPYQVESTKIVQAWPTAGTEGEVRVCHEQLGEVITHRGERAMLTFDPEEANHMARSMGALKV